MTLNPVIDLPVAARGNVGESELVASSLGILPSALHHVGGFNSTTKIAIAHRAFLEMMINILVN